MKTKNFFKQTFIRNYNSIQNSIFKHFSNNQAIKAFNKLVTKPNLWFIWKSLGYKGNAQPLYSNLEIKL